MKTNAVAVLIVVALELVLRWMPAFADADRRYDFDALVRAMETNAKATQDLVHEVREAGRKCK